nr:MAG TPA: hypothetical protein [Caudoviricetes sp.]
MRHAHYHNLCVRLVDDAVQRFGQRALVACLADNLGGRGIEDGFVQRKSGGIGIIGGAYHADNGGGNVGDIADAFGAFGRGDAVMAVGLSHVLPLSEKLSGYCVISFSALRAAGVLRGFSSLSAYQLQMTSSPLVFCVLSRLIQSARLMRWRLWLMQAGSARPARWVLNPPAASPSLFPMPVRFGRGFVLQQKAG